MNQPLTIRCKYTLSDLIKSCLTYRKTTLDAKIDKAFALFLFVAGVFIIYSSGFQWWVVFVFLLIPFAWFGLIQALQTWIAFKRNAKLYVDEFEITLDDNGIYAKNKTTEIYRLWSAYDAVLESDSFLLLVYGKGVYTTIPKRVFSDNEEINGVREVLKQKVGRIRTIGKLEK